MIKNRITFDVLEEVRDVEALWIKIKLSSRTERVPMRDPNAGRRRSVF